MEIDDWCFEDEDSGSQVLEGFAKLYEEDCFTDIILCVENKKFPCHKMMLAVSSPYFMGMFSSNMSESQQDEVELKCISSVTLELVLDFIYKREVMISVDTVQDLLSASNMFQLISLRNACAKFMMKGLKVTNCIGFYFFACAHMCSTLAKESKKLIQDQFVLVCCEQEFLELPVDKITKILDDDLLKVSDEKQVYEAGLRWLNYELTSRKNKVFEVMSNVRFVNINPYYFWDKVEMNFLVSECVALKKVLHMVHYYHLLKNRHLEVDLNFMPRQGMSYRRAVLIFTCSKEEKVSVVEKLDFDNNSVSRVCDLPNNSTMPACAVSGDNLIYVAGGHSLRATQAHIGSFSITTGSTGNYVLSRGLYVLDPRSMSWNDKAAMHEARSRFPLTVLDRCIFAVGGKTNSGLLAAVEKYDIQMDIWQNVAPLPEAVCGSSCVGYKGQLYVFGGNTSGDNMVQHTLRYEPSLDQWTSLRPMSSPTSWMGAVVYKDQIYVLGGLKTVSETREYTNEVEIYDPASDTWSEGPNLPAALNLAGAVKYNNKIFVMSERDEKRSLSARTFLLSSDGTGQLCWTEAHELPTTRTICGCVVANIPRLVQLAV